MDDRWSRGVTTLGVRPVVRFKDGVDFAEDENHLAKLGVTTSFSPPGTEQPTC